MLRFALQVHSKERSPDICFGDMCTESPCTLPTKTSEQMKNQTNLYYKNTALLLSKLRWKNFFHCI